MNLQNPIVWRSLAWPSMIVQQFNETQQELEAKGIVIGKTDQNIPFAYNYSVVLSVDWVVKTVSIIDTLNNRELRLRQEASKWYDAISEHSLSEFDGVPFIDLSISPFTNSLPIKTLALHDQPQAIETIYFDENTFSLRKVQQFYSKIGANAYKFQDGESDFTAQLITDDGIVMTYEHLFERI